MPTETSTAQREDVPMVPPSAEQQSTTTAEAQQAQSFARGVARAQRRQPDARSAEARHAHHLDEAVRQAEADGRFADLPGKGKPLTFRPEEGLASLDERWLANHILKNADYVPLWAALSRAVEQARARSAQALDAWRRAPQGEAEQACARALTAAWESENDTLRQTGRSPTRRCSAMRYRSRGGGNACGRRGRTAIR